MCTKQFEETVQVNSQMYMLNLRTWLIMCLGAKASIFILRRDEILIDNGKYFALLLEFIPASYELSV